MPNSLLYFTFEDMEHNYSPPPPTHTHTPKRTTCGDFLPNNIVCKEEGEKRVTFVEKADKHYFSQVINTCSSSSAVSHVDSGYP